MKLWTGSDVLLEEQWLPAFLGVQKRRQLVVFQISNLKVLLQINVSVSHGCALLDLELTLSCSIYQGLVSHASGVRFNPSHLIGGKS